MGFIEFLNKHVIILPHPVVLREVYNIGDGRTYQWRPHGGAASPPPQPK